MIILPFIPIHDGNNWLLLWAFAKKLSWRIKCCHYEHHDMCTSPLQSPHIEEFKGPNVGNEELCTLQLNLSVVYSTIFNTVIVLDIKTKSNRCLI